MLDFDNENKFSEELVIKKYKNLISLSDIFPQAAELVIPELSEIKKNKLSFEVRAKKLQQASQEKQERVTAQHNRTIEKLLSKKSSFEESITYYNKLASLYKNIGDIEAAEYVYQEAQNISTIKNSVSYNYAQFLHCIQNNEKATSLLKDSGLEENFSAQLLEASILIESKELEKARDLVVKAFRQDPLSNKPLKMLSIIAFLTTQYDEAIELLNEILLDEPTNTVILRYLGLSYYLAGKTQEGKEAISKALDFNPFSKSILLVQYQMAKSKDEKQEFEERAKKYLELNPDDCKVLDKLGCIQINLGKYDKAFNTLKRAIAISPKAHLYHNAGLAQDLLKGKNSRGLAYSFYSLALETAEKDDPIILLSLANIISVLMDIGKGSDAVRLFEQHKDQIDNIKNKRYIGELYYQLAFLYQKQENIEKETECLLNVLKEEQSSIKTKINSLSTLCAILSDFNNKSSKEIFLDLYQSFSPQIDSPKITKFKKEYQQLLNNMSYALLIFGKIEEANNVLFRIKHLVDIEPYVTATFGLLNISKGNLEEGTKFYKKSQSLFKSKELKRRCKQKLELELGKYYLLRNDFKESNFHLSSALKIKTQSKKYHDEAKLILKTKLLPYPKKN